METAKIECPHCGKCNRVPAAAAGTPRCGNCHQPLPWIVTAGDDDFTEVIEKSSVPILVDLWASWCRPCLLVSPALEQLATERAGRLKLVKVDVDAAPRTAERFVVRAVPTLLVLDHGEVLARQAGAAPVPELRRWLDHNLSDRAEKDVSA
ncbi:thioredoxin family protein [Nocardia takedensis]|uniref:thioredoxin family protein n=1 Tax=Nocardia takedensis TaxID=259390 RepID=UPI0002E5F9BE|nr:thioredoxin domain-containing protein [Nocardia takedensis]